MKTIFQVNEKLLSTRDTIRRFWGDRYVGRIAEFKPILEAVMKKQDCDVLPALMLILETMQKDPASGMLQSLIISAAVEMIEAKMGMEITET